METSKLNMQVPRAPNDCDKLVGTRLRQLRTEFGLSIQTLANQVGLSHQQVQKYETGKNRISAGLLPSFAAALGVDVGYFFEDNAQPDKNTKNISEKLRKECEASLRRTKSEEALRSMARVLKALSN